MNKKEKRKKYSTSVSCKRKMAPNSCCLGNLWTWQKDTVTDKRYGCSLLKQGIYDLYRGQKTSNIIKVIR